MLKLARGLALPVDFATQTSAILGKRGSGKSNTAVVLAEQLYAAGVPFAAIDPTDTWWGLKSSRDGKSRGLGVYVFGGEHADLPLEHTAGELMADVLVEHRISAVLSVKHFTIGQKARFVTDLALRLFRRNRDPFHVFLEEAHELAPQNPQRSGSRERGEKGEAEMVGAINRLWKLGRTSGIGGSAITQRAASLNKNITEQAEVLVVHRIIGPRDREAIKAWIKYHGESEEILGKLSGLKTGEAYVWAPDYPEDDPIGLQRVKVNYRATFDSSRTPKVGEKRAEPKALAPVDLEALRDRMSGTIERAKAEDPKELQARIRELERELRAAKKDAPPPDDEVLERARREGARQAHAALTSATAQWESRSRELVPALERLRIEEEKTAEAALGRANLLEQLRVVVRTPIEIEFEAAAARRSTAHPGATGSPVRRPSRAAEGAPVGGTVAPSLPDGVKLKRGERAILAVVAAAPDRRTAQQIGTLAKYAIKGGTFRDYIRTLKKHALIEEDARGYFATPAGMDAADLSDVPRTRDDLIQMWKARLKRGERDMLDVVLERGSVTVPDLADAVEMEQTGGTFRDYLRRLRKNGLVDLNGDRLVPGSVLDELED